MEKKQDPRTVQTTALIKQTLLGMMKKTAFNKVTVSEVCKTAGINRGTFYLHFCDLWAVLEELEEDTIRSEFRSLLTDSIYYTLASRCGLDPMERQEEMDFVHITDYNCLSVLTFIGNATSRASESVLVLSLIHI